MKNKLIRRKRQAKKQQPSHLKQQSGTFFEAFAQHKYNKYEEAGKKEARKKSNDQPALSSKGFFHSYMRNINGRGEFLSGENRAFFESRMNENFGNVKIHKDKEASNAAGDIGAKAFTWKNHIVVNNNYYEEGSLESRQLLAHELKHVQQQKNGHSRIQLMANDEKNATETEKDQTPSATPEELSMEKDAEQEEKMILAPESVPDIQTFGQPVTLKAFANSVSFNGRTDATFNGGAGKTRNLQRTASGGCAGCAKNDCFHYTGQLVINYRVTTRVTLPPVPGGLTKCQHDRVRNAINNVLSPHEQDHVAAFNQYNGTVTLPINYTGCSAGIKAYVQNLHDANAAKRAASARAASAALDPFHVNVDLDCQDEGNAKGK